MIDLTPVEVRKKKGDFKKTMRGYDPALVDDFLDLVADRLDQLVRENITMTERLARLEHQVSDNRERERALTDALVTAQEMREEVRQQTAREAEITRRTAEQESETTRRSATQESEAMRRAAVQEASQIRAEALQAREREEEVLRRLRARQQQLLQSYRTFLAREMAELQVIGETLEIEGLSSIDAPADSRAQRASRSRSAEESRDIKPRAMVESREDEPRDMKPRATVESREDEPRDIKPRAMVESREPEPGVRAEPQTTEYVAAETPRASSSASAAAPQPADAMLGLTIAPDPAFAAPAGSVPELTFVSSHISELAADMDFGEADVLHTHDAAADEDEDAGMRMLDIPIAADPQINMLDRVSVMGALEVAILDDEEPFAPEPVDDDEWDDDDEFTGTAPQPEAEIGAPDHDATVLLENALRAGYRLDLDDDAEGIGSDADDAELLLDESLETDDEEGPPHDWLDKMIDDEERDH